MKTKKGMMMSMYAGPFIAGLIFGIIVGVVLMAYMINHGMMSASAIPV